MRCTELLLVLVNEQSPAQMAGAIRRACQHCARTSQALVLDLVTIDAALPEVRSALLEVMRSEERPIAVSVVVPSRHLDFARGVSLELAIDGVILGEFDCRETAERYALRERRLAVSELLTSSASSVRRVRSTSANARA